MLPLLLAAGLLGAGSFGQKWLKQRDEEDLAQKYRGLLGQAGADNMGPPTEGGQMGHSPGSGLLADPNDPTRQLQFAAGVLGLPGQTQRGLSMLDSAFGRAQQAGQFKASQGQQQAQFDAAQTRQAEQFGQSFGLQKDQFANQQAQQERQAQQWLEEFTKRTQDTAFQQQMARDQLAVSRGHLSLAQSEAATKAGANGGLPALEKGWTYVPSASGIVAAPIPGTADFSKAMAGGQGLRDADARVSEFMDLLGGKEIETRGGKKMRTGGTGTELWGEGAAKLSTLRGGIIADVAKLRDMGVLQQGELENIEKQLPDPTSWTGPMQNNKSTLAAYKALQDQIKVKQANYVKAHPWMVPPPPAGFTPR